MRMKPLFTLLLIAILAALTNCTSFSQGNSLNKITIAVVEDNPGEAGNPNSQSAYAGVKLAVDQMKAHGGPDVEVIPYTDNNDPNTAKQVAGQIAQSNTVAVIGHSSIETSDAAGEVYDRTGIPVINVVPVTDHLVEGHPYYFNITYTAESEAAYLANYVRKVLDENKKEEDKTRGRARIIFTNDGYGQALAEQFRNTFKGLGGRISLEEMVSNGDSKGQRLDDIVSAIIAADSETDNPGTIFIATDDVTAAQLVILMKRKGVSYPIAGASNLSTPAFKELIGNEPEEITLPGYFTDGILTARSIIFDSANRYANQFLNDYQTAYKSNIAGEALDPSDKVINGYDAALTILAVIKNTEDGEPASRREKIHQTLLGMDKVDNGVQGLISSIYFESSRSVTRAARFGIYQNGEIVSANTQFEPIQAPNEIRNLQEQIERGRIMTVNGGYVYKANIVYAGVDLFGIDEIDIKTSTYKIDFYLWLRYRPNVQDVEFQPEDFVFTNAVSVEDPALIRDEEIADGTVLKTFRVGGVFKNQFDFHNYPFDHQRLIVEFRNRNAATSFTQYVVDRIGMRYETETELLENFRSNGAFDSIFGWQAKTARVDQDTFPTSSTFGNPQNFDRKVSTNYSLINIEVDIQRDSLEYIFKSLLPLLITLVLAYITFFLPLGHSERLAVGSTALLTTAFFHLTLADALPEIGYTVAMEYLFYASYVMSALIVLLETLGIRLEKKGEDARKKADKERFQKQREDLNMIGRFIYPSILVAVILAGFFVYNGAIQLGPNEADSQRLVDLIIASGESPKAVGESSQVPILAGDEVNLTLSAWRPEDTKQIQALLDSFQQYAASQGKNITIAYRPVMSVNYDSILDLQLSRGEGPDLFYVRPFSVNGNIAKYLEPLNDFPIDENFEFTKSIPWKSRAGNYYALPFVGVVQGVYYNKELFEKYEIAVPVTWGEFLQNLETIKKANPNMIPIANALNQTEDSEMFMSIAANFLGGPDGREQLMRTDRPAQCFNGSRVVNTFKAIENLKPYLPAGAGSINSQNSKELFFNQKAVMLFGGSWDVQKVTDEASFEWGVFAVPASVLQETYVIFQSDIGIGINRATAHPEEARMFLEWLMTKDAVELTSQNLPGFYPLNNMGASRSSNPNDAKFLKLVNDYPGDIRWMYAEINDKNPSAPNIVRRSLYDMVTSDLTSQEAAQRLQDGLGEWYEPAQTCK